MVDIDIDFKKKCGKIKPMHGVNNGPLCYGSLIDVSSYYKEFGVPFIRLHDVNWPHPREVDVYTIFPDFSKDPKDPASYDFERTDEYIKSVLDTGAKIIYRLGSSIEHTSRKYYINPPKDFMKWAKICLGIIKHYNEGWAQGFFYNIQYWEIWNEPEGYPDSERTANPMWTGTLEEFLEFYKVVASIIKREMPSLKIGGFSYSMVNPQFLEMFLSFCHDNSIVLDFFSWHTYTDNPEQIVFNSENIKHTLLKYGFDKTEIHFNEWNYMSPGLLDAGNDGAGKEYAIQYAFERLKNEEGASFDTAVLMVLQDCPVDVANYYDAAPTSLWSMFNQYGVPQKAYYSFKAFKNLYDCRNRCQVSISCINKGLYACAGIAEDNKEAVVLISNFGAESREYSIRILIPLSEKRCIYKIHTIDRHRDLQITDSGVLCGNETDIKNYIPKHTVVEIMLKFSSCLED